VATTAHYWKSSNFSLGETSALAPAGVDTFLVGTANNDDDTLLEVIASVSIRQATHTTGLPPVDWWVSADAHATLAWDPAGTVTDVDYVDDTVFVLGFETLYPHVQYYGSTVGYSIVWKPDSPALRFKGRRKGEGLGVNPDVTISIWHTDQHAVFQNVPGYTWLQSVNADVRTLWETRHV